MDIRIIHLQKTGSTNDIALRRISEGVAGEGDVFWADEQTRGRGHGKNMWESERGKNLTFSLVLQPRFIEPAQQFMITQAISVALLRFLKKYITHNIKIKWPNDIYVGKKKIAGILIQNILSGSRFDYSVVGVGLNVNQQHFYSNAPNPVSMIHFTRKALPTEALLNELLTDIGGLYSRLASPLFLKELTGIYTNNLFRLEEWSGFQSGKKPFRAKITGIGPYGRLILQMENGKEKQFGFKEVEFVM